MSSSSSHSHSSNTRANQLYRSQQNLSTTRNFSNHSSTTGHHGRYHHQNSGNSNQYAPGPTRGSTLNKSSRTYGSASNIAVLERNLNSANFSVAPQSGSNSSYARGHHNANNNNNNFVNSRNNYNSNGSGVGGDGFSSTSNVDNWLNAWDNPPPQVPSAPVAAKRTQLNYFESSLASGMSSNNNLKPLSVYSSSTKPTSLPLKPIQPTPVNLHSNRNVNDPWSGLSIFWFISFALQQL